MKQIIEKINKSWHSNPPCDQQIMLSVGKLFPLPDDYKEFMLWSNGGEGNIGSQYLSLWKIEDLMQLNKEYQIQKYLSKKSLVDTAQLKDNFGFVSENIERGNILAAWSVGFGGVAEGLAKMAFGNRIGAEVCGVIVSEISFIT